MNTAITKKKPKKTTTANKYGILDRNAILPQKCEL